MIVSTVILLLTVSLNVDGETEGYFDRLSKITQLENQIGEMKTHLGIKKANDGLSSLMRPDDALFNKNYIDQTKSKPNDANAKKMAQLLKRLPDFDVSQERLVNFLGRLLEEQLSKAPASQCMTDISAIVADLQAILKAIIAGDTSKIGQYYWVFQLLDSLGTGRPAGILVGNTFQAGMYRECKDLHVNGGTTKFDGMFCGAVVADTAFGFIPTQTKRGFCFPSSCSDDEVAGVLRTVYAAYQTLKHQSVALDAKLIHDIMALNITAAISDISTIIAYSNYTYHIAYNLVVPGVQCHRPLDIGSDSLAIAMLCILSLIGFFMVLGTLYDVFSYQPMLNKLPDRPVAINDGLGVLPTKKQYYDSLPLALRCLMAFSVYTNTLKMLDTTRRPGTLDCVHGIRFFSMSWVILGHTYIFGLADLDNIYEAWNMQKQFAVQAISNATVSVDSFFLLSGLLLAYLWFKETDKKDGKNITSVMHWVMYIVHRFIRLTPVYMLVLGVDLGLIKYFSDGPLWPQAGFEHEGARQNWWRNLFYIQNFWPSSEMVFGHAWYLANDMQFYILAPIMLVLTYFFPIVGIPFGILVTIGSAIWRGVVVANNNYVPLSGIVINPVEFNPDRAGHNFTDIYMKPWMRVGPYIVGLIVGYVLFKILKDNKKFKINTLVNISCWFLAAGLAMTSLYGIYDVAGKGEHFPRWAMGLYCGPARTTWAIAVAWVCFACCTGNGGPVDSFLSWKALVPLSRLTYTAYLVHPFIMYMYYGNMSRPLRYDGQITFIFLFFAFMIAAYAVGFVFSLMLEGPVLILEKLLIPIGKGTTRVTIATAPQYPKIDDPKFSVAIPEHQIGNNVKSNRSSISTVEIISENKTMQNGNVEF